MHIDSRFCAIANMLISPSSATILSIRFLHLLQIVSQAGRIWSILEAENRIIAHYATKSIMEWRKDASDSYR